MSRRGDKDERRKHTDRFARLPHRLLSSPAYRALSSNARSLLIDLTMMENGKNNGVGLFLSVRDAADRMGVADLKAAMSALTELQLLGFIEKTHEAHFAVKAGGGSRARYWRLTWEAVNGERGPTNDFQTRQPEPKTRARQRMEKGLRALKRWKQKAQNTVEDSSTHMRQCVAEIATSNRENVLH